MKPESVEAMASAALADSKANKSRHENINQSQIEKGEFPHCTPSGIYVHNSFKFVTANSMERLAAALRKGEKCRGDSRQYPKKQKTDHLFMLL